MAEEYPKTIPNETAHQVNVVLHNGNFLVSFYADRHPKKDNGNGQGRWTKPTKFWRLVLREAFNAGIQHNQAATRKVMGIKD